MSASISDVTQEQQVHSTCFLASARVVRRQVIHHKADLGKK